MRIFFFILFLVISSSISARQMCFNYECRASQNSGLGCGYKRPDDIGVWEIFQLNDQFVPWGLVGKEDAQYTYSRGCVNAESNLREGINKFYFEIIWGGFSQTSGWVTVDTYITIDGQRKLTLCEETLTPQNYADGSWIYCIANQHFNLEDISPEIAAELQEAKEVIKRLETERLILEEEFSNKFDLVKQAFDNIQNLDFHQITEPQLSQVKVALELFKDLKGDLTEIELISAGLEAEYIDDIQQQSNQIDNQLQDLGYTDEEFNTGHTLSIPQIELPALVNDYTFSETDNFYKDYADKVLIDLQYSLDIGDNEAFLLSVDAWLQTTTQMRSLLGEQYFQSPKEWKALNDAYTRVENLIFGSNSSSGILDRDLWFVDSPVTPAQRSSVSVIKNAYPVQGDIIERKLRTFRGKQISKETYALIKTIEAIGNGIGSTIEALGELNENLEGMVNGAVIAITEGSCQAGAAIVLNDFNDIYELVIGENMCTGKSLSTSDRIFAGVGIVAGSGVFWRGVADTTGLLSKSKKAINITGNIVEKARILGVTDNKRIQALAERLAEQFPCGAK